MKIIRVFPRRTSMTPDDADVRINTTPDLFDEADEVHISCLFSWDKQRAEQLADAWAKAGFNVKYEELTFILFQGFYPTVPFYNRSKSRVFRLDKTKIRDITYTPDFTIECNGILFIIEAKGIENDTVPIKKKLFRKLLADINRKCVYFEVHTKRDLLEVINIIKSYELHKNERPT